MKPNSPLLFLVLTVAFGWAAGAAEDRGKAEVRPKGSAGRPAARAATPAPAVKWPSISEARPCDSTACRPVRLVWSPTAPGS